MYVRVCVCVYICIFVIVCVYACMCVSVVSACVSSFVFGAFVLICVDRLLQFVHGWVCVCLCV